MARFMVGLTAWAAGTVIAVCVAWFGANVVIRNAGVGPGIPVLNATVLPASAVPSPARTPPAGTQPTATAQPTATVQPAARATHESGGTAPSPSATPTASAAAGEVHAYALTGGNVTLDVVGDSVQLVTAVPSAGYSVQTWSGTGWLRVDFSSGPQVSSLIASWYLHAPTVTVTN
ncbi:MAG TPA: hypothetical protein VN714_25665 [Trebonia sp.]|nr:hypothetical protein [Trebonia sp.]